MTWEILRLFYLYQQSCQSILTIWQEMQGSHQSAGHYDRKQGGTASNLVPFGGRGFFYERISI